MHEASLDIFHLFTSVLKIMPNVTQMNDYYYT